MSFDAHAYHIQKLHAPNYLAAHGVLDSTMWQHTSNGLEVANQSDLSRFIGVLAGHVTPFRLKCGPAGNHINKNVSPLNKAKYQFHLTRPADHELAADYQAGIAVLEAWQSQVGSSPKNMVINDVTGKMVHMVRNVFCKWDIAVPDSPHGWNVEGAQKMDHETQEWPIPEEFVGELDESKYHYRADPLPLYHDGHLVEPSHANEVINGAIVEVHFGVLHWRIRDSDTFQADVDKVVILRPGYGHHTMNYKCSQDSEELTERPAKKARQEESSSSSEV